MKRYFSLIVVLFLAFSPLTLARGAEDQEWGGLFYKANEAYKESRFQDASNGYLELIERGHENGHLYYNLGNSCFRLKDLGRAILYYERARLFLPRDADVNFNLRYALEQTEDAIPESNDLMRQTFFWLDDVSLGELFLGFAVLNGIFWAILLLRLSVRLEWTYYVLLLLLIVWLVAGLSWGAKWYQLRTDARAIVLPAQVNVLAGPHMQDTVLFKLHQGAVVHYERSEEGWALINLSEGKRGWIRLQHIEKIVSGHASPQRSRPSKKRV